jgi:anti-sigma factor RsiW
VNCNDAQMLIPGYLDGELDLVSSLKIEEHLRTCTTCMRLYANQQVLRAALRTDKLYFQAPAGLQRRIQVSLRQASKTNAAPWRLPWRWFGVAAALACAVLLVWGLARGWSTPTAEDRLAQEVLSSHVRSLMGDHLADVASTDQHTVKPWFDGKLDFSPPVEDLASQGFPLIGGRLDYLDNRPVAALVYQRQKHFINLFVWPTPQAARAPAIETLQGYNLVHWAQSGMTYWAVSDLNDSELQEFVRLLQHQAAPAPVS